MAIYNLVNELAKEENSILSTYLGRMCQWGSQVRLLNRLANCPVFASRLSGHKLKHRT